MAVRVSAPSALDGDWNGLSNANANQSQSHFLTPALRSFTSPKVPLVRQHERCDVVSGLLNHVPATVTRRHDDHQQYEPQKRQALEAWAARLKQIVEGTGHVDKEG